MLLLRIASRSRWAAEQVADSPEQVARAAVDLELATGEIGLSVYRIAGDEDAREVSVRFALTCRDSPRNVDYVVFSADLAEAMGLIVSHVPSEGLDAYLNERHHEILGLTAELGLRLAAAILSDATRLVGRIPKADLVLLGAELCRRDPAMRDRLRGHWPSILAPLLDDPMRGD